MFQLVLGVAGSGKTTRLMEMLAARARAGQPAVLLVPEQFSSSAESLAYHTLGDVLGGRVEVLSFRTLAGRMLRHSGQAGLRVLDDAGRVVFVRRAVEAVGNRLSAFARQKRSAAFCGLCAQTLNELKTAGATPGRLAEIAHREQDDKLTELALIFAAYEAEIAGTALDPEDRLTIAAQHAGDGWLAGKACFVDSFDGFTAPEYDLLAQLTAWCDGVTVALCCDGQAGGGPLELFAPVRRVAARLTRMAEKAGVPVAPPVVLAEAKRPRRPVLAALNRLLATGDAPDVPPGGGGLTLSGAADEWEEARLVAAEMHRLALEGVPYSRMAVVCRDTALYETAVRRQLMLYDIPVFYDVAATIEYTAPAAFIRAALGLLRGGLSAGGLLALLKTGLCGFGEAEVAALENYVFTWRPTADDLRAPFEKHPDGLMARPDPEADRQLALAEELRVKLVPVAERFLRAARGAGAASLSKAVYLLMDHLGAPENVEALAGRLQRQDVAHADVLRRAWDMAMEMLDTMAAMLGDEKVDAATYDELFLLLVRATDFGQAPRALECAVFSGADRMRLAEPDYCFVLGVCEGEFPMQVGYSGLLTHTDRDRLVAGGIELPGSFENRTLLEEMFFYKALCSARKGLYLSWPARRGGEAKAPAVALGRIEDALKPPPLRLCDAQLAAAPAAAFELLGEAYRNDTPRTAALHAALAGLGWPDVDRALALLGEVDNPGRFAVADTAALKRLMGGTVTVGASAAEKYYSCRFAYYLERVLRVRPRKRAELSPAESGTFVHHVLERVLAAAGADFGQCGNEALAALAHNAAEAFVAENGLRTNLRTARQLERIEGVCVQLLCFMRDAAAQSAFTVEALELSIGMEEGGIPPLEVAAPGGGSLRLVGVVDRLDTLRRDGKTYLCIVDYKTGDKTLQLDEVYCGRNLQMMLYMDALCQSGRFENPVPAAVLYLGSDPAPQSGVRSEPAPPPFRYSGLVLDDAGVLDALDDRSAGGWLPLTPKKDGGYRQSGTLAGAEKFGNVLAHVRRLLGDVAAGMYAGAFDARPLVKQADSPCGYCPYRAACRHEDGVNETQVAAPGDVFEPQAAEDGEVPDGEVAP